VSLKAKYRNKVGLSPSSVSAVEKSSLYIIAALHLTLGKKKTNLKERKKERKKKKKNKQKKKKKKRTCSKKKKKKNLQSPIPP